MLIITSPAKTLDETSSYSVEHLSQPQFIPEAKLVHASLSKLSQAQLQKLLATNDKLTRLNFARLQEWQPQHNQKNSRPAIHMYKGDIYRELKPNSYNAKQQEYAQKSLRILSGYYGLLRPYDLMQTYRLEMKAKLSVNSHKTLADFWHNQITESLNQDAANLKHKLLLNLASVEYAKPISFCEIKVPVITVNFQEKRNGKLKTVAINSKRARGMMIEFCIQNQVQNIDELKAFTTNGYKFRSQDEASILFVK